MQDGNKEFLGHLMSPEGDQVLEAAWGEHIKEKKGSIKIVYSVQTPNNPWPVMKGKH